MARTQSRLLVLAGTALALTGCHDNEIVSSISVALGLLAGGAGLIRRLFEMNETPAARLKTGGLVFLTGLFLGGALSFYLFSAEDFRLENAVEMASARLRHLAESHSHGEEPAPAKDSRNWLVARAECPECGKSIDVRAEFKYGALAMHEYEVGDAIEWGGDEEGTRTDERVWVRAWAEKCPACKAPVLDYAIRIERNEIAGIVPVRQTSVWRERNWVVAEKLE